MLIGNSFVVVQKAQKSSKIQKYICVFQMASTFPYIVENSNNTSMPRTLYESNL